MAAAVASGENDDAEEVDDDEALTSGEYVLMLWCCDAGFNDDDDGFISSIFICENMWCVDESSSLNSVPSSSIAVRIFAVSDFGYFVKEKRERDI